MNNNSVRERIIDNILIPNTSYFAFVGGVLVATSISVIVGMQGEDLLNIKNLVGASLIFLAGSFCSYISWAISEINRAIIPIELGLHVRLEGDIEQSDSAGMFIIERRLKQLRTQLVKPFETKLLSSLLITIVLTTLGLILLFVTL